MRITFILPTASLGGGTKVVAKYCDLLRKKGHDVTVVSVPQRPVSLRSRLRELLREGEWRTAALPAQSHLDGLDIDHRVLEKWRPPADQDVPDGDVVVATWWETAEWVAALGVSKGAKAYFVQGHEIFDHLPQERTRATYRMPLHKIVVSRWLGEIMAQEYGNPNCDLVPNSVDLEQFHTAERGKQPNPTFGFLYSPSPTKSVRTCIAAIEIAKMTISGLHAISFGAQKPSRELALPDWVEFHHCPDQRTIPQLYANCDAWLFSSEAEGFGLPLLEAMACRTPVIATPAGAAPELLACGGGIPVPTGDPGAIVEAMQRIHNMSDSEWRKMSGQALATASSYTWDDAVKAFEEALLRAVSRAERNEIAGGPSTLEIV